MNRAEALNILGLDDDATPEDIKAAYKECAQILHPDRFANNKKLENRATEQFKRLQEAYDYLNKAKGSKGSSGRKNNKQSRARRMTTLEAQIAGLTAAKSQLVAQRDTLVDERRNAIFMVAGGIIGAVLLRRIVWVAGIASAVFIYGIVSLVSTCRTISTIDEHLEQIEEERRELEEQEEEDGED